MRHSRFLLLRKHRGKKRLLLLQVNFVKGMIMATSVNESMPILIVSSSWRIIKATQAAQKLLENQNNIVGSQLDELFNFPSSFLEQRESTMALWSK